MNIYEKLIDILIGICIMLLFPVLYFNKKSELIIYEVLQQRLNEFVQEITIQGKLTKDSYEQFHQIVNSLDHALIIELQYEEYRYEPEYIIRDHTETPTFTGNVLEYLNVVTKDEILNYIYQEGDYMMSLGGYLRVSITVVKDNITIYSGGAIRANLSLCDYFCNHSNRISYNS